MKLKRILSMMLITTLVLPYGNNFSIKASAENSKETRQYVIKVDTKSEFNKVKAELVENDNRVVNHKLKDEIFLEDEKVITAELTSAEAKKYSSNNNITIEEDYKIEGLAESAVPAEKSSSKNIKVSKDTKSNTEKIKSKIKEINLDSTESKNAGTAEYSDNPEEFVPCSPVTDEKLKNEVLPWNIECVSGNSKKNEYKGNGVKVAIIDSGVDVHNDLKTKKWVDFSDTVEGYKPVDNNGHGTQMAGVIGAQINGLGTVGIASDAEIYSVKALNGDNTATVSSIVKSIEWCIDNDIDIINMSFGTSSYSSILEDAVKKAYDNGILMIAAAGNDKEKGVQYPAKFDEVVAVGGVDGNLNISEYSATGNTLDLVAPGEKAQTTGFVGSYCISDGSSIATAHVTGVAAAIKSIDESMSSDTLRKVLFNSAIKLGMDEKNTQYGYGLVNYENAKNYYLEEKNATIQEDEMTTKSEIKEVVKETYADEDTFVEGAWSKGVWNGTTGTTGTGHYSLINTMDLSYFDVDTTDYTAQVQHRYIVADAAYFTDVMSEMNATEGNARRDSNGAITSDTSYPKCFSPYHAKSPKGEKGYTLDVVVSNHMAFLYELARRRLVLGSNLGLVPTNYNGNTYYDVYIGQTMKRRIVSDISVLYNYLNAHYAGSIDMNDIRHRGYLVLGVYLHLLEDFYCHRAVVQSNMVFASADGSLCWPADTFASNKADCTINAWNFKTWNDYWQLYTDMQTKQIPMIDLKDYLNDNLTITCNGVTYSGLSAASAYEDNPFFWHERYDAARCTTELSIDKMMSDTGNINTGTLTYYVFSGIPLN